MASDTKRILAFYLLSVSPYQVTTIIIHIAANVFQFGRVIEQAESPCPKFKEGRSWNGGCEDFISKENKQRFQHRDHGLVSCFLFPILFWSIYFFEAQFQFWIKFKLLFLSCFVYRDKLFISGKFTFLILFCNYCQKFYGFYLWKISGTQIQLLLQEHLQVILLDKLKSKFENTIITPPNPKPKKKQNFSLPKLQRLQN